MLICVANADLRTEGTLHVPRSLEENNLLISILEFGFSFFFNIKIIYILKPFSFSVFHVIITTARKIGFFNVINPDGERKTLSKIVSLLG